MSQFECPGSSQGIDAVKAWPPLDDSLLSMASAIEADHPQASRPATTSVPPPPPKPADHPELQCLPAHNKMLVLECLEELRALIGLGLPPFSELLPWHRARIGEAYIAASTCEKASVVPARLKLANTVKLLCELLEWMGEGCSWDDPRYWEWVSQGATDQQELPQESRIKPEFTSLVSVTALSALGQ